MKILMLVNWKVKYCSQKPMNKQPPDYYVMGEPYWFYRYFNVIPDVDVIDMHSFSWLEKIEKEKIRFYIWQTVKLIPNLKKYDLIVSHGMQSGVVLSLWRRLFRTKAKHIVFDIGSFNSAAEHGIALKLMQFSSKSIDGIIYHTSSQMNYYRKYFPWVVEKAHFIRFGTDLDFFRAGAVERKKDYGNYILCVGYAKRDWDTLVRAYQIAKLNVGLRLVGHVEEKYKKITGIEQVGFMSITELMSQIYNAKFCVLPLKSFNYSYGQMTLMQQMAMEKCVIASEVPSLVDYMQDRFTVLEYEAGNVIDCAKKLRYADENENTILEIGRNARIYLVEYCNEKIMAREIEKIYKKVLDEKR